MENMEQLHRNWCHACKDWGFHISTVLFTISVMQILGDSINSRYYFGSPYDELIV